MRNAEFNHIPRLVAVALAVLSLTMCAKTEIEIADTPESSCQDFSLTISSDDSFFPELKTGMESSGTQGVYTPYWSAGDKMQIYIDNVSSSTGSRYTLENTTSGVTASFTGSVGSNEGGHTIYGFYPASALASGTESECTVSVDVPYMQNPTLDSFDPACDILAAKPMEVSFTLGESATISDAKFARQLAILKIVPIDATTGSVLSSDKVLSVKMTSSETILTGRARLNLETSTITGWVEGSSRKYVKADYLTDKNFCIRTADSDAAFMMVAPGIMASGSSLDLLICTDSHLVTKSIELPGSINLVSGRITTLKIRIVDDNVQTSGAALPLTEGFSDITGGNSAGTDGSNTSWAGNDNFPDVVRAYKAGGAVRIGTGSSAGSITTRLLNLASPFTVSFMAKGWSTVEGNIVVTVGSQSKTVSYSSTMDEGFEAISVPFYGESSLCTVSIATTAKRCFIDSVSITSGKSAGDSISVENQVTIPATSGKTASFSVASDYDWTAATTGGSFGFSFTPTSGSAGKKVTITVTATSENTTTSSRTLGGITISNFKSEKTVTISQSGQSAGWAELPAATSGDNLKLCKHSQLPSNSALRNYSFLFDDTRHCSLWVAWPLHSCYMGSASRTNGFGYDPLFIENSLEANIGSGAYWPKNGSSYSHARGHQMPSAERTVSEDDNNTTFYATNMTPQLQGFNGGVWEELESLERLNFVCSDTLYIVTGPYFDPDSTPVYAYDSKGNGKACQVPTHYWKIFLRTKSGNSGKKVSDCSASELQCVGFWFEHAVRSGKPVAADMKSVKDIETLTGFTFFPNVPNAPKSTFNASDWGL